MLKTVYQSFDLQMNNKYAKLRMQAVSERFFGDNKMKKSILTAIGKRYDEYANIRVKNISVRLSRRITYPHDENRFQRRLKRQVCSRQLFVRITRKTNDELCDNSNSVFLKFRSKVTKSED